jgi:hypothetical protein
MPFFAYPGARQVGHPPALAQAPSLAAATRPVVIHL